VIKFLFFAFAYLLGAVPVAVGYAKYFHKIDITQHGSGNAGATNSLRVLGKKAGIIVLFLDILKGFLPVFIFGLFFEETYQAFWIGIAAILGHIFSVFTNFKGGKGIATSLGVILAIYPLGALVSLLVFVVVVYISRYVSLGSILAAICFASIQTYQNYQNLPLVITSWALVSLLVFTHRQNIQKLINGTENKIGGR
jgi:acyl phosphate:glycerol-3-phosphate acyltransferase